MQEEVMLRTAASKILHCLHLDFAARAKTDVEAAEKQRARKFATRYSRGSVRIQNGAFLTTDELESERQKARRLRF